MSVVDLVSTSKSHSAVLLTTLTGYTRVNFQPYKGAHLTAIIKARIACAEEGIGNAKRTVLGEDAITFACMKISGVSGDARRVLDICRYFGFDLFDFTL